VLVCASAFLLVGAASATDDGLWLFPASHGANTVAAWRAQEGETDDQGAANQALLLEKDAPGADTSAAAHLIGYEGVQVRAISSLAYEYRVKDGVCTTTDPRWALFIRGQSGRQYLVNLGCKVTPSSPGAESGWIRRTATQPFIRAQVLRNGGTDALGGTVAGLALVFDHAIGHVFVDNIRVQGKGGTNTWTFAGDNGGTKPPGGPSFSAEQTALLAAPFTADEQLSQDDLLASLTADEWAAVNADATG
jgi:hypothetical protein